MRNNNRRASSSKFSMILIIVAVILTLNQMPFTAGMHTSKLIIDNPEKFIIFDGWHVQAKQGDSITFRGWYDFNEEPPFHLFNGKLILESENIRIEWSQNQLLLTIFNLTEKHTGLYSFYHPALKKVGQIYLYVSTENSFAPRVSNEIFCDDPKICNVPCILNNYEDKDNVRLYLDGKLQNSKFTSGVGFQLDRRNLNSDITVANATCVVHNETASYLVNFLDQLPSDWDIQSTIYNPWPKVGDPVSIVCSVIVNDSYSGNSLNNVLTSVLYEGDDRNECHLDSSKPSEIKHKGNVMMKEKEFSISSYTSDCRGKITCQVRNSSGRFFNKPSFAYLDQLETISRTDAEVETVVGAKTNVAAKLRSPSKELLLFKISRIWEKVTCQETTCVITNETAHVAFVHDNTTIDFSYDVSTQNSGWHHYSLDIYRSSELIQRLTWDVFVRGQVLLHHNCSKLLLVPTLCVFTSISYLPDDTIMFITTEEGKKEILYPSNVNKMKFFIVKTYERFINTSVEVRFQNQYDKNPILLTVFAVEFSYFVHPTFDNANAQDIYEGDNVTIKGRIALSNGSFLIQHESDSSLCPSKSEKFPECRLSNYNLTSDQTFRLISNENVVKTIIIPAAKKVVAPFDLKISTIDRGLNSSRLTCPIGGSPITYNWTVNGVLIPGQFNQHLWVNPSELPGPYVCCGINRVGYKSHTIREENVEKRRSTVGIILCIVVVVSTAVVLITIWRKHHKSKVQTTGGGEENNAFIVEADTQEEGAHFCVSCLDFCYSEENLTNGDETLRRHFY